jgi:hypothetical protein
MSVSKKTIPVDYSVASEHGTIDTKEGPMPVRPGFHVIDRGNGAKYATPAEEFHKLYDDHGNGKASPKPIMKVARPASGEGQVKTGWGETLPFKEGQDMIVRHGTGDYGVVKNDIFHKTYNVHGKAYK